VRILAAIPLLGRMIKETLYGDPDNIYYFLAFLAALWVGAILVWDVWALLVPFVVGPLIGAWIALVRWLDRAGEDNGQPRG